MSNIEEHLQKEFQVKIDAIKAEHHKEISGMLSFPLTIIPSLVVSHHIIIDLWDKHDKKLHEQHSAHKRAMSSLQEELHHKKKALVFIYSSLLVFILYLQRKVGVELKMVMARVMAFRMQLTQFKVVT